VADRQPYLGVQTATTGRTPYLGASTSSSTASSKKKGGGGILGTLERIPGRTVKNVTDAAKGAPAGIVGYAGALGRAADQPFAKLDVKLGVASAAEKRRASGGGVSKFVDVNTQMAGQVAADLRHPLRNPGNTLLDVLPVVGGAARVSLGGAAALRAAKAGETAGKVAKAAVAKPNLGERTLRVGDMKVHPEASPSSLGQVTQHATDKWLQKGADANPAGKRAAILNRRVGKTITAEARQAERIAKAAPSALIALGKKLKPGEQKALQVVAEQAPLTDRITAASARVTGARDATARANHQAELDLLHKAQEHLTVRDGLPVFDGPTAAKMAVVYKRMEKVAGTREELLKGLGLLTDASIASRKTDAARIALGAMYETPTPGKLGKPSQGLIRMRAYVARLEGLHERATTKAAKGELTAAQSKAAGAVKVATDREFDVQGELDSLNKKIVTARKGLPKDSPEVTTLVRQKTAWQKVEIARQDMEAAATRVEGATVPTAEEITAKVEALRAEIEALRGPRDKNLWKEIRKLERQAPALRKERKALDEGSLQMPSGVVLTGKGARLEPKGYARAQRLGGALSVARDRLLQMEEAAARKVEPTGILGLEGFKASEHAIRIPDVATRKGTKALTAQAKIGGQGTIGHLKQPGSVTHPYTGKLREHALRRQDTTTLVGEAGLEAAKYDALRHIHELVRTAATAHPTRPDDIAVRLDNLTSSKKMPLEVRKFLSDPEEALRAVKPGEQAAMIDRARSLIFFAGKNEGAGWQLSKDTNAAARAEFDRLYAEGKVGWVPRRMVGELGNPAAPLRAVVPGRTVSTFDAINNASRFAILYLKPAYAVPNILGNAALNVLQQGFAAPRNLAWASRRVSKMTAEDYAAIDAVMGEGIAQAISAHGAGLLSGTVDKAAQFWSRGVDAPFRRASFVHEANKAGYKTAADIQRLLHDPAERATLNKVGIRANREIIDYANLNNVEREIIRRVIFFYPWVKGSTVYTGRLLRDKPVATLALNQLGQQGNQWGTSVFGPLPSYYKGLIPFAGGTMASNPASASMLGTPAQVLKALTGSPDADSQLAGFLTPALSLALAEVTRRNQFTGQAYPAGASRLGIAKDVLAGSLPQKRLYDTIQAGRHGEGKQKAFPPSVQSALLQFFLGGIAPRKVNKPALNQLAARETQPRR